MSAWGADAAARGIRELSCFHDRQRSAERDVYCDRCGHAHLGDAGNDRQVASAPQNDIGEDPRRVACVNSGEKPCDIQLFPEV